ncbi:class I SAM-dependent methyltransferase [Paenibacillus athensensis]|uniref:Methyltransferase type 11 domain-containing protein n=1 Tax=Paenibacillus athensensis TaxID=1967502 RepID=A0A4Y8QA69_9BACL|nr:class I SAM-dependent methyltransferase [Paenibacillus athensensis]MCD1259039.1 class I SAM-dependent methyltransferase [Paenibacillus athensensis]
MQESRFYEQIGVAMTSRSYEEYVRMFSLDGGLAAGSRVLDVAGGAASFTADAQRRGLRAEAADPLYAMTPEAIERHGRDEIEAVAAKMDKLRGVYNWEYYGSVERHKAGRVASLEQFLGHYRSGDASGTYSAAALPDLPYEAGRFDHVFCSHFLFLYEQQFDYAFHEAALRELLRVCKPGGEVRVYPLLNFRTEEYSRMEELLAMLRASGAEAERRRAQLPFLPNSEFYLYIRKQNEK